MQFRPASRRPIVCMKATYMPGGMPGFVQYNNDTPETALGIPLIKIIAAAWREGDGPSRHRGSVGQFHLGLGRSLG
jgi:hypothetical protein